VISLRRGLAASLVGLAFVGLVACLPEICRSDDDCVPSRPHCYVGVCTECLDDSGCILGSTCASGVCLSRSQDGGTPTPDGPPGKCLQPGQVRCSGECVQLLDDVRHCGQCGNQCRGEQICQGGKCVLLCPPPMSPCGDRCADLMIDNEHCGQCSHQCADGRVCEQSSCRGG